MLARSQKTGETEASPLQSRMFGPMHRWLSVLALPLIVTACGARTGGAPLYGTAVMDGTLITMTGMAGGRMSLARMNASCRGYAQRSPSHVLATRGGPLRITTDAPNDATLAARLPNGMIVCDDDGGDGLNPLLDIITDPGNVEVWVGSYSGGGSFGYTLLAIGSYPAAGAAPAGGTEGYAASGYVAPDPGPTTAPPPTTGPAPAPPPATRVPLEPRIPMTLYASGVTPTIAIWTVGSSTLELGAIVNAASITLTTTVNGVTQPALEIPADPGYVIVSLDERSDETLVIRAERAPSGSDPGMTMLWHCRLAGTMQVIESWSGTASERGPRWSR